MANRLERLLLKAKRQVLQQENAKYPDTMTVVEQEQWPASVRDLRLAEPHAVWRSSRYLAVLYREPRKTAYRLSICRAAIDEAGRLADGLSWDELQSVKSQCGFANIDAIEIYPRDRDVVNVANLRHLWLVGECAETWRSPASDTQP